MYGRRKYVPRAVREYVRQALDKQVEDKHTTWVLPVTFGSISTTWTEANVSSPAQSVVQGYRVGAKIRIKSLEIDGVMATGVSGTALDDPYNIVRVVIMTTDNTNTAPLQTAGIGMNSIINTFTLAEMSKKYLDQYIPLTVTGTEKGDGDGYTPNLRKFSYYKRWKNGMPIEFEGDNAVSPTKTLWVSMLSDSAAVPGPGFICGYMKICFEDA